MNNLTTFYIVRHGESEANAGTSQTKHLQGSPLTDNGRRQAMELAERFSDVPFAFVISSDLSRATQTAEILTAEKKIAIETTNLLRERSYGSVTAEEKQRLKEDLKKLLHQINHLSEKEKFALKLSHEMESGDELISRIFTLLREIAVGYSGKNVLVVSHGEVVRAILIHLGEAEYHELPNGAFANAGYIVLQTDGLEFFIKEIHGMKKVT